MSFEISTNHVVSQEEAKAATLKLEIALGEIANGTRKIGKLPLNELSTIISFIKKLNGDQ